jgi:hypothetical protein
LTGFILDHVLGHELRDAEAQMIGGMCAARALRQEAGFIVL